MAPYLDKMAQRGKPRDLPGRGLAVAALSLLVVSCGTFRSAAAATPTPQPAPVTAACINAPAEAQPLAPDQPPSALLAATQEANAGQRQIESRRAAAKSTTQRKELDRSHVRVLGQLQHRLYAIQFPPEQRAAANELRTRAGLPATKHST